MRAAALTGAIPVDEDIHEFAHVLDGVVLHGDAARLAAALDRGLLEQAGWDPVMRILRLPSQHRLLGRKVCRVERCVNTVHNDAPEICHRCFTRLTAAGRLSVPADGAGCGVLRTACPTVPRPAPPDLVGAVRDRPAGAAPAGGARMSGGGVHPHRRRRGRLLQYPLSTVVPGPAR